MATSMNSRPEGLERLADSLEKPLLDDRSYRVIKLANQLEALLIHDPDTDKASAAMDVDVGSLADPPEMQGMAHAVEHLLFMGTEKYPGENDYNSYLTKYGGHSNAFTASTSTNYYFELSSSATSNSAASSANNSQASLLSKSGRGPLYGALDRFAQFFLKPLFLEDTLDRELRAVDSENKKNLQSDNWRLMQLERSLCSEQHPYHQFATGNYKLLHDDPIARGVKIREEFMKFYQKNYSANRMRLCVLGKESLDELEGWVVDLFSGVYNQDLPKMRWDDVPAQTEKELCTQIFAKPVMDTRSLTLNFLYPDEQEMYDSRPSHYLSHLIGHEGPGSILTYLNAKGWASSLSAGANTVCPGTAFFSVSLRLTTEGLKNYQEIIKVIFQYIAMLNENPPYEWIVQEQQKLAEVEFRFKQKAPAARTTSHLSGVMQKPLPRDMLLCGESLIRKFNPDGINRGLSYLRPDNFRFTLTSQEFPGDWDQRETWYGTEYKMEKIPRELMDQLIAISRSSASERLSELHLPNKNEFIPQRLDVEKKEITKPALSPKLIRNDTNVRVWYKKDDRFWVPKANVLLTLRSPMVNISPFTNVVLQLYKDLVEDSLIEYAYDAELAGLSYNLGAMSNALEVTVGGYNDKMHVLLEKVLVTMRDIEIKQDRFDIVKERLIRGYKNAEYMEPYRQVAGFNRWLTKERSWASHELLAALPAVTKEDVARLYPQALRQMHIEMIAHGNLYKEDALRMSDLVEATLKPQPHPKSQWATPRNLLFPPGADYRYERQLANPENVNHCIDYMLHFGDSQDRPLRAKVLLLSHILSEPCFDTLRTKEQLGYIVSSGPTLGGNQAGFRILIQSEKDCPYLETRIDAFLTGFEETLSEMSESDFNEHRIGVINSRLEKLKNLDQETGRLWHHITSEVFDFELVYRDVEALEALTKNDLLTFFSSHLHPSSPTRAKTAIHLIASTTPAELAKTISPVDLSEKLANKIAELLTQMGAPTDKSALTPYLEKVDIGERDAGKVMGAVGEYMQKGLGMAKEQVDQVSKMGEQALPGLFAGLGIGGEEKKEAVAHVNGNGTTNGVEKKQSKTIVVEDVKSFKASLPLSAAPKPVKDLEEFEDLESKL
ncbi:unnamed protein product [Zymoseptoria tritici ST99CH_1A5]|uniref:Peptidase M16 N-terminal domain-containing protein n=1 Tax=Zymoseptoria tritici ST99CH_1A5 TaxID=1276529 RepID=A0A1Y6LRY0_ZYMTR|nr:unnamed protein product [Zymoseptoria tritici ST99CH_1A5]